MVLLGGLVLKLALLAGPLGSDDLRYFAFASKLAALQPFDELDHAGSRVAFLAIVGLPGAIAGSIAVSGLASVVVAVLTELVAVLYLLRNAGPFSALLAAVFLSFNGIVAAYAGTFLPDTLLALLFLLAALLCMRLVDGKPANDMTALACGFVIGLAYSTKDTGILLLPCVLFAVMFLGQRGIVVLRARAVGLVIAGFAAVWLSECLVLWALSDRFFYRYEALSGVHNLMMPTASSVTEFMAKGFWNAYEVANEWELLLFPAVLSVVITVVLLRRGGGQTMLAVTIGFCFAYLLFGSSSFTRLVNLPFQERYVQPLLPLLAVGAALLLKLEEASTRARQIAIATALVASVPSTASGIGRAGDRFFEGYLASAAVAVRSMAEPHWSPVFVDARTYAGLEHLIDGALLQRLKQMPQRLSDAPAGSYLIHPAHPCSRSPTDCGGLASARTVLRISQPHRWLGYARPSTRAATVRRVDSSESMRACANTRDDPRP